MSEVVKRVVIREMRESDLEHVLALEKKIFPSPWTRDFFIFEMEAEGSINLVLDLSGVVIGYICAGLYGKELHITNMAVEPSLRRRGFASILLLECIRKGIGKSARWLTLEVRENNLGAREFYKYFGFREIGMRIGYYEDTAENAILMATGDITSVEYMELLKRIEEKVCRSGESKV